MEIFASISTEFAMNSIICTSPSKTFNIAGLQISNIIIPNAKIRYSQLNTIGLVDCQSAYTNGSTWLNQLREYLKGNLDYVRDYLEKNIPEIKLIEPEGTYLIWLDCSALNLSYKELENLITDKSKLWLDGGIIFGKETAEFERINIACPRSILKQALENLSYAIHS